MALIFICQVADAGESGQVEALTLTRVLARVLDSSPELAQYPYHIRAAEAHALQAGLMPNPEVGLAFENAAGSGDYAGGDAMETSLSLSQVIEMGGKRHQRRRVGEWQRSVVDDNYQVARLDVLSGAAMQFLTVVSAQWALTFAEHNLSWTNSAVDVAETRHKAGSISQAELSRARSDAMRAKLAVHNRRMRLDNARIKLASHWGAEEPDYGDVKAGIFQLPPLPSCRQLKSLIAHSPRIERFATLERLRQAELDLAIARGRQDIRLGIGVRHDAGNGDNGLNLQFSMPIGASDRNQGGIRAAREQLAAMDLQKQAKRIDIATQLRTACQRMQVMAEHVQTLREDILPEAQKAQQLYQQGYRQGRFSYLALIEARQQRLSVEQDAVNAAIDFYRTLITLEKLTGESLAGSGPALSAIPEKQRTADAGRQTAPTATP